jgi:hypothetical protein
MSALPPKADIAERHWDVRNVPKADMAGNASALWILFRLLLNAGRRRSAVSPVERTTQVEVEKPNDDSDSNSCVADFGLAICPATHAYDHEPEDLGDKVSDEPKT